MPFNARGREESGAGYGARQRPKRPKESYATCLECGTENKGLEAISWRPFMKLCSTCETGTPHDPDSIRHIW